MTCDSCALCVDIPNWEHRTVDGVFIKQMYLEHADTLVPQHSHQYAHTSMLAKGSVRVWAGSELLGDFKAPYPIFIKAREFHRFLSLEPDTLIYCIHNASRKGVVEIHQEA